ncbi:hypothetical protein MMC34_007899 [Xylographa carneopallida]|nr:hypothetical protein [Xylographa carneopallida]
MVELTELRVRHRQPRLRLPRVPCLVPFRASTTQYHANSFDLPQEEKQQLWSRKTATPRERPNEREELLKKAADDEPLAGVVVSIETASKRKIAPKKKGAAFHAVATKTTALITDTSVANTGERSKAVSKKPAAKTATKTAATPAVKTTTKTKTKAAPAPTSKGSNLDPKRPKRKIKDEDPRPPTKRRRGRPRKTFQPKIVINQTPTQRLDVFVFCKGSAGELGLGSTGNVRDVRRPRLNLFLSAAEVGVVQLAVGVKKKSEDEDEDSDDEDENGISPLEAHPTELSLETVPPGTVFTQVAAGDSITLALTDDGIVYGCGSFRPTLLPVPTLSSITHLACGDHHTLALSATGTVFAWGSGEQHQLGRRVVPRRVPLPKDVPIAAVGCGAYHSFALSRAGVLFAWGLNSYGQTGLPEGAGADLDAVVRTPTLVPSLAAHNVVSLVGCADHSLAVTAVGHCLTWGRVDGARCGIAVASMSEQDLIRDEHCAPCILRASMRVKGVRGVRLATAGTNSSIVVDGQERAWAWGFSENYQTGLGTTDDVPVATRVENMAVAVEVEVEGEGQGDEGEEEVKMEEEGEDEDVKVKMEEYDDEGEEL